MSNDLQLFRLSPEIWKAADIEDILKTSQDMMEMGIFKTPYQEFAIEVPMKFMFGFAKEDRELARDLNHIKDAFILFEYKMRTVHDGGRENQTIDTLHFTGLEKSRKIKIPRTAVANFNMSDGLMDVELVKELVTLAYTLHVVLTVLLATRNHQARTKVNPDLLAGKSNKKNGYRKSYPYTTTISIGNITESHVGDGEDPRTIRPHLRRGHIRTQRFGPDLAFERKIFIEPVFVNASQGWIAKRAAYNVSGKAWSDSRANAS